MVRKSKINGIKTKNNRKKPKIKLFSKALLLKQTLVSTWKSKLQLVILLLLSAFSTSLITGVWISYNRMVTASIELGLNNLNFDAVLPYSPAPQGINQIANQAFSLKLGKIFYQKNKTDNIPQALYFDNTIIGQQLEKLTTKNINIRYNKPAGVITSVAGINWINPDHPLEFNLDDDLVKGSLYGQLRLRANTTNNLILKQHYSDAANDLYRDIFVQKTAPNILYSLETYLNDWIRLNPSQLSQLDDPEWILKNRINYQKEGDNIDFDYRIPDVINLAHEGHDVVLAKDIIPGPNTDDVRARPAATLGLNGQWMQITRSFDNNAQLDVYRNLEKYNSLYRFNQIRDKNEPNNYSWSLVAAVAALEGRDLHVRNQYTGIVGNTIDGKQVNGKFVDIGLPNALNHTDLKVFEGIMPTSKNEIVISPQYARYYKYKPGDTITINNLDFIITGIGGDAVDIYPTINDFDAVPNTRTEFIAYVTPDAWNNNDWYKNGEKTDITLMYFTPWSNLPKLPFDITLFNDYFQKTIFSNNRINDLQQDNYNQYLISKYVKHDKDPKTTYPFDHNLIVTSSNPQFLVYSNHKKMFNSALVIFRYASIAGLLFLIGMVIFITTLIVKKAIQKGQVSMGILKSLGYKTVQIMFSYLAYPLITLLVAIPIGWLIGLVVQVYFTEIFNTLFVLPYNVFNFDIVPLFIAIAIIVGFIALTTILTAFRMLRKEPLFLIKRDSDLALGTSHKFGKIQQLLKNKFRWRFLLILSKASWKKILVTASVISLATLSIVATTAIPATIFDLKNSYFHSQKYNNYYQYQNPMPNMPMSKYGLYCWQDLKKTNEQYYPVAGAMPWPQDKIIYTNNDKKRVGWFNPVDFSATEDNLKTIFTFDHDFRGNKDQTLKELSDYYKSKSNGSLELSDLTWAYSWLGGKSFSNQMLLDLQARDHTPGQNFSNTLINFASTQLPGLLGVSNPGVPPGPDAIQKILRQVLPGFVRQSLDALVKENPDVYNYFAISHNTVALNPTYDAKIKGAFEELVTQFQIGSDDSQLAKKVKNKGLMDVVGINPHTSMLVLNDDEINGLQYQADAKTIPMVINRAFQVNYGLEVGSTFNAEPSINTLYYRNNKQELVPLPKSNWFYGSKQDLSKKPVKDNNGHIWSKSGTKWSYEGKQLLENTPYSVTAGYDYNGMYDPTGQPIIDKDDATSWNNMNNVWLRLPDDIDKGAKSGSIHDKDGKSVPFTASNIARISDASGEWIQPFSYRFVKPFDPDKDYDPMSLLLNVPAEWFMGMVDQGILLNRSSLNQNTLDVDLKNMPTWWENIIGDSNPVHQYHVIGVQDSYDSPHAYIDQKWANQVVGYSANNSEPYYANTTIPQWFSGKLSATDNIYDIIGRMAYKAKIDDYTMYATKFPNSNSNIPLIAKSDLLSRTQDMINKMASISLGAMALFITITIICSILIVIMITDLFTDQFRRFMAHMKAEGYTNREINSFTLGIFTPWALVGFAIGFCLGFLTLFVLIRATKLILPFTIIWWILPVSFLIIGGIYLSTFIINNYQLNKMNLIDLLKADE